MVNNTQKYYLRISSVKQTNDDDCPIDGKLCASNYAIFKFIFTIASNKHDPRTMEAMFAKAEGDIETALQLKRWP